MSFHPIIALDTLEDGEARIVPVDLCVPPFRSVIVTRVGGAPRVYWNVCQHLPVPLDSGLGELSADADGRWICQTHGALYRPEDGLCVGGPCEGEKLEPLAFRVHDGTIEVELDVPSTQAKTPKRP